MKHRWDSKITKKKRFKTCINCGTIYETGMPPVYYRPYSKYLFFGAGDCSDIQYRTKILNEDKNPRPKEGEIKP